MLKNFPDKTNRNDILRAEKKKIEWPLLDENFRETATLLRNEYEIDRSVQKIRNMNICVRNLNM